jgi:23S rRNA (guanosine2251-2'-O)-methyltransferase
MKKLSMEELGRIDSEAYKASAKSQVSLLLDDVRSMANVGSIFRTADCFLTEKIYLCGITPCPPHREIEKTALGATESVPWDFENNPLKIVMDLKFKGYLICCIEQVSQSTNLLNFSPSIDQKILFILGNEVFGVKQELIDLADTCIEIPQFGTKHSFNVAVTTAIVLWDTYSKTIGKVR